MLSAAVLERAAAWRARAVGGGVAIRVNVIGRAECAASRACIATRRHHRRLALVLFALLAMLLSRRIGHLSKSLCTLLGLR